MLAYVWCFYDQRHPAQVPDGRSKEAGLKHVRMENIDPPLEQHASKSECRTDARRTRKLQWKYFHILWDIVAELVCNFRCACQIRVEVPAVQSSQERENVFLHAAAGFGIGKVQDRDHLIAGTWGVAASMHRYTSAIVRGSNPGSWLVMNTASEYRSSG